MDSRDEFGLELRSLDAYQPHSWHCNPSRGSTNRLMECGEIVVECLLSLGNAVPRIRVSCRLSIMNYAAMNHTK